RVDGTADVVDEGLVVPAQQLDQAVFLAGELRVERALRGAGVPDDVGDGGVAETTFDDRRGHTVEQSIPERVVDTVGLRIALVECRRHIASLRTLAHSWYHPVP